MKRGHSGADPAVSRAKRRKEIPVAGSSSDVDITSDPVSAEERARAQVEDVRTQGLKLWQTVKDATNKEGRTLSDVFVRKPSKKLYPDYYLYIQHPIALDDIKKQLETNVYPTLEAIRQDFELCFENAMNYNMKDSGIWKDAKDLMKVANKAYSKMVPPDEDLQLAGKKPPSLHRLAKVRLQKLIETTDETGRILSDIFMEYPSRTEWAIYYVQIKQPQCFSNIQKRLKKKEYNSMVEFADDVELVCSNAMAFNQDHTQIWEDALTLQTTFRQLMSDLPPAFAVARYQKPATAKIKIKMPAATAAPGPSSPPPPAAAPSVVLRVPTVKAPTPVVAPQLSPHLQRFLPNTLPSTNMIQPAPQPAPTPTPAHINSTPASFNNFPKPIIPKPKPIPTPVATPAPPPPAPAPVVNPAPAKNLPVSNSPALPPLHPSHMLKGVSLKTEPRKRPFLLDHRDGVKTWAMRLGPGERALSVADVTYMGDDEEDSSDESESDSEESGEEEESDPDGPAKNGKKNVKGKGRSRKVRAPTAAMRALQAARAAKREARKIGEVQVKLNGFLVTPQDPGQWMIDLQIGANLLEVGEKGGLIWKVYAERVAV
ncbi:RSC complex protein [Mycena alexandri]|uniref:RSC complex protein n=1 Tax=Mycena alexandri TaxID=1745969 RepID=A0AAD6T6Y3_9AGAR|nr:RSC complex protein [Mycena alexandri]